MIVFDRPTARHANRPSSNNAALAEVVVEKPRDEPNAASPDELSDAGMTTAEYAVGTIAACALAAAG